MSDQTLTEFLLARASEHRESGNMLRRLKSDSALGATKGRQAEALRRIAQIHEGWHVCPYGDWETGNRGTTDFCEDQPGLDACPTIRLVALPYADHPDYRQEWRP